MNYRIHTQTTVTDVAVQAAFLAMSTDSHAPDLAARGTRCVRASLSVGDLHREQAVRFARNVSGSIRDSRHFFDLAFGVSGFGAVPAFRISFAGNDEAHSTTLTNDLFFDLLAAARAQLVPAYSE